MRGVNMTVLVGNLGRDPELRHTKSGKAVCELSIATEGRQGEIQWHDVVAWDKAAEIIARNARRGSRMYLQGEVRYRVFQDDRGSHHKRAKVHVDEFVFMDPKRGPLEFTDGEKESLLAAASAGEVFARNVDSQGHAAEASVVRKLVTATRRLLSAGR